MFDFFQNLQKDEIIYVGDAPSDIAASRQVGIPVIAAAWAETADPEKLRALKPDELLVTIPAFTNLLYTTIYK